MSARGVTAVAALAVSLLVPGNAAAVTAQEIIAVVERQRAAHGIPPGLREDAALSRACAQHNAYLERNPGAYPHREQPGMPGFTPEGAAIAPNSVLFGGVPSWAEPIVGFGEGFNPFEVAPFHLADLLDPALLTTGAAQSDEWACVVVRGAKQRDPPPDLRLYSYPGPRARDVRRTDVEFELPYAPGDLLGYAQGTPTGPHVYVFAQGGGPAGAGALRVHGASVVGPDGPVGVRWLDSRRAKLLYPTTGLLVVREPVRPGAYCASFRASVAGVPGRFVHRVGFVTEGAPAATAPPSGCVAAPSARLRLDAVRRTGPSAWRVRVSAAARARGRPTVTAGAFERGRALKRRGRPRRSGGRVRWTFAGTARPIDRGSRGALLFIRATLTRSDGGPGAVVGRTLLLRG